MRILLPPSETKTAGGRGRPLRERPAGPLTDARNTVIDAVQTMLSRDVERAARVLDLPASVRDQAVADNRRVLDARTAPALLRYSGVVYDGLGAADFDPPARRLAGRCVLIVSGLFGVLRGDEPVPPYRVPAKAVLPGLGGLAAYWRPRLDEHLGVLLDGAPVLDLRSSDYLALWRPNGETAERVITPRFLSPVPNGGLRVVSYPSKLAKGRLAAAVVRARAAGRPVVTEHDIAEIWIRDVGGADADLHGDGRPLLVTGGTTAESLGL